MTLTVHPGPAEGTVRAPPSKSLTHRALVLAAMAGEGTVRNPLWGGDTRATRACLQALGVRVEGDDPARLSGPLSAPGPGTVLDCRNSGTTLRLLTGVCATLDGTTRLDGDASLRRRPVGPLVAALRELGAKASAAPGGTPPVEVEGPLPGGACAVPGDVSSQFVSALLLAGLWSRDGVEVRVEGGLAALVSRPYVDLTIGAIEAAAGQRAVEPLADGAGYAVRPADLDPVDRTVEGDWSGAAFPLGLGALGGPVTVTGLDLDSRQGDRAVLDHLEAFGADVEVDGEADGPADGTMGRATVVGGALTGADVDLRDTPDLFPLLCALACHADGETALTGAAHLRAKESDRIGAMVEAVTALGGDAEALDDGALVRGRADGGLSGGSAKTRGDHRVLMALAVAATRAGGPVTLSEGESYSVSYPSFLDDLTALDVRWTR